MGEEVAGPSEEIGVFDPFDFGVGLFGVAAVAGDSVEEFFVGHGAPLVSRRYAVGSRLWAETEGRKRAQLI